MKKIRLLEIADDETVGRIVLTPQILKRTERFLKRLKIYEEGTFAEHCIVGMVAYAQVFPLHADIKVADFERAFTKNKILLKRLGEALNKSIDLNEVSEGASVLETAIDKIDKEEHLRSARKSLKRAQEDLNDADTPEQKQAAQKRAAAARERINNLS